MSSTNEEITTRFSGTPWFGEFPGVFIGGAGGIGSWVGFFLSRIGFPLTICDFDSIEIHNLGGQLFRKSDIGKLKVHALAEIIRDFTSKNIAVKTYRIQEDSYLTGAKYCIAAFDNMQARKLLFEAWIRYCGGCSLQERNEAIFIDGRLEAEQLQIFCVPYSEENIENYRKFLFDDSEAESAPCTIKQTSHSASLIASLITGFLTNHHTNVLEGQIIRDVPFFHEFFIPLALTENEPTE